MAIPRNFSYSSQVLELDNGVVIVGEYYYNNSTKAIEKRSNKRKKGEFSRGQKHFKSNIKWKVGPDPKENGIHNSSTLNAFSGANAILMYELSEALDISRTRVA